MDKKIIERLFEYKKDCVLVGFQGDRWVDVISGPFDVILTTYYMTIPWDNFYIRLPNGAHYPNDYIVKGVNEKH
jgi:hypothetical protein